jgi:hypothetical protein
MKAKNNEYWIHPTSRKGYIGYFNKTRQFELILLNGSVASIINFKSWQEAVKFGWKKRFNPRKSN